MILQNAIVQIGIPHPVHEHPVWTPHAVHILQRLVFSVWSYFLFYVSLVLSSVTLGSMQ